MGSSKTSCGERISTEECQKKISEAKQQKLDLFMLEHGYHFCEDCGKNTCKPIDCSHDISVDECKKSGRTELAWDINNITLRGRACHSKYDRN